MPVTENKLQPDAELLVKPDTLFGSTSWRQIDLWNTRQYTYRVQSQLYQTFRKPVTRTQRKEADRQMVVNVWWLKRGGVWEYKLELHANMKRGKEPKILWWKSCSFTSLNVKHTCSSCLQLCALKCWMICRCGNSPWSDALCSVCTFCKQQVSTFLFPPGPYLLSTHHVSLSLLCINSYDHSYCSSTASHSFNCSDFILWL